MSIRKITLASGTKCWQARVMVDGQRRSALRDSYEAAKIAEADLRRALQHEIAQAGAVAARPGTVRDGLRGYVARLEARGKSPDSVVRARQVEGVLAGAVPGLLAKHSQTATELAAAGLSDHPDWIEHMVKVGERMLDVTTPGGERRLRAKYADRAGR